MTLFRCLITAAYLACLSIVLLCSQAILSSYSVFELTDSNRLHLRRAISEKILSYKLYSLPNINVETHVTIVLISFTDWSDQSLYALTVSIMTNYDSGSQQSQYCPSVLHTPSFRLQYAVVPSSCIQSDPCVNLLISLKFRSQLIRANSIARKRRDVVI